MLKIYRVSTAKSTIKKPLGEGNITSISLNLEWHPTLKTIKAFKQEGIKLPSIIPCCIRMKNKEVFELATLLNQYTNIKNLNSIKVILF